MLNLYVDNVIRFNHTKIPSEVLSSIMNKFTYGNPEYFKKKAMGFHLGNTPKKLYSYDMKNDELILSRGTITELTKVFKYYGVTCKVYDQRVSGKKIIYRLKKNIIPKQFQSEAVDRILKKTQGLLIAPPGAGKTIMALQMIDKIKKPTLIIVHTTELLNQWKNQIEDKTITKNIGQIGAGKKILQNITISMMQTLINFKKKDWKLINEKFGMIIIDECHRTPCNTLFEIINKLKAKYRYGLTATPKRKDGKHFLLFDGISHHMTEISDGDLIANDRYVPADVQMIFDENFEYEAIVDDETVMDWNMMTDAIISNHGRNKTIMKEIIKDVKGDRTILVLTTRVEHCKTLSSLLSDRDIMCEVLLGETKGDIRKVILERIRLKKSRVLIATEKLASEGLDIPQLDTLHLIIPTTNRYKLKQMIGRIRRKYQDKQMPLVKDYVDNKNVVLCNLAKKRAKIYKTFGLNLKNVL